MDLGDNTKIKNMNLKSQQVAMHSQQIEEERFQETRQGTEDLQ